MINYMKFLKIFILLPLTAILIFSLCSFSLYAEGSKDDFLKMREEEIHAKEARVNDLTNRIDAMQKQVGQERTESQKAQEKIWKEFQQGLEVERKNLKEQLGGIEERQKVFEKEIEKKQEQDNLKLNEKQEEVKRMMSEMERLRGQITEDKKSFEDYIREYKEEAARRSAEESLKASSAVWNAGAVERKAENKSIQIAGPSPEPSPTNFSGLKRVRAEYYIEIGDSIDVDVWRVPDLGRSVVVRPDGRISMPLVGDLEVEGMTLVELRNILTKKFTEYVLNPQVSLSIRQFGGRKFIILGEVGSPGVYRFQQEISLIEGIALAGGFKDYSRRGKIMIIRGDIHKEPQVKIISANMENVLRRGMISENIDLMPNDIIYVGKDVIGNYKEVLDNVVSPFFAQALNYYVLHSAARADHNS